MPAEKRVPGAQSRPVAGSDCLNTPPRSAERAALDMAVRVLRMLAKPGGEETGLEMMMRLAAAKALADIATLVPDAVKR